MTLHFTMSQDGKLRATVRVDARIGRENLAAVCLSLIQAGTDPEEIRRRQVEEELRVMLAQSGQDGWFTAWDDVVDEQRSDAYGAVARLFPELTRPRDER
jgi:hypothetical protein